MKCVPVSDKTETKEEYPKGRPDLPKGIVKYRTMKIKCSDSRDLLEAEDERKEVDEDDVDQLFNNNEAGGDEEEETTNEMDLIRETFSRFMPKNSKTGFYS